MNDKERLMKLLDEYGLVGGIPGAAGLATWLKNRGVVTIEWFSVIDNHPGEKGTYLTVTKKGAVRTNHYYGNHEWGYGNDCLYWAYMPDPPKREE